MWSSPELGLQWDFRATTRATTRVELYFRLSERGYSEEISSTIRLLQNPSLMMVEKDNLRLAHKKLYRGHICRRNLGHKCNLPVCNIFVERRLLKNSQFPRGTWWDTCEMCISLASFISYIFNYIWLLLLLKLRCSFSFCLETELSCKI